MDANATIESDDLIQQLQDSVNKLSQDDNPQQLCVALIKLGQAYLDEKQAPVALTQFEQALKIAKKLEDKELQARLFGYQGLSLKMLGNYVMALQSFKKSNGIASSLGHTLLRCDSFLQIGILKSEMGTPAEAIEDFTNALEIATQERDGGRKIRIAGSLADTFYSLRNFDKALEYYGLAADQARNLRNLTAECSLITKMGNVSLSAGEPKTAIAQYDRALEIASSIENRGAEINILGGLFRANALLNDLGLATLYGEKVIQLARESNHFEAEITNIHTLASFLIDQARYSEAISYLDQGRALAEGHKSQEWLLFMDVTTGTAQYRSGDHQAAVDTYSRSLGLARGLADKPSEIRILGYLAEVQAERALFHESIQYAEQALQLAQELDEFGLTGEQQMLLAFDYKDLNQIDQAIQYCQAAMDSYKKINASDLVEKAQQFLSELSV